MYIYIYINKHTYIYNKYIYIYIIIYVKHIPQTLLVRLPEEGFGCQDLTYVEFFAGTGNVWRAVRADSHPCVAVDLCYMEGLGTAMDILSDSGFAFHPQFRIHIYKHLVYF